jgi:CubicO group peptidase (beta-lactamase class C family)
MTRWLLAQLGGGQADGRTVMSSGTVARQHAPHMVLPEDRTFPASTRHAYGLGWMIGQYRNHRLIEHGGGIDGFQTECMLLPDDGIGVAVMTNTSSSVPPFDLQARRGLRFEVKGQPGITAEFELDQAGEVVRLVAQPLGIFRPKT